MAETTTTSPSPPPAGSPLAEDSPFNRDRFLFKQKLFSINEKYDVIDEDGTTLFYIERPRKVIRSTLAMLGAIVTFLAVMIGFLALAMALDKATQGKGFIVLVPGLLLAIAATVLVAVLLSPKRHVTFYADAERTSPLLHVRQDFKVALIDARYTIHLPDGAVLGQLSKNLLTDFWRKRWHVLSPTGAIVAIGHEDNLFYAILRRALPDAAMMLRTNFVILAPDQRPLGEFIRKLTILDRYVLDLSADPGVTLDRRVGVALGVMLDTGEHR